MFVKYFERGFTKMSNRAIIKRLFGMVFLGVGSGLFWQGMVDTSVLIRTVILAVIGGLLISLGSWLIMDMKLHHHQEKM